MDDETTEDEEQEPTDEEIEKAADLLEEDEPED